MSSIRIESGISPERLRGIDTLLNFAQEETRRRRSFTVDNLGLFMGCMRLVGHLKATGNDAPDRFLRLCGLDSDQSLVIAASLVRQIDRPTINTPMSLVRMAQQTVARAEHISTERGSLEIYLFDVLQALMEGQGAHTIVLQRMGIDQYTLLEQIRSYTSSPPQRSHR